MTIWRSKRAFVLALLALFVSAATTSTLGQEDHDESLRTLRTAINGSTFETSVGRVVESYKYENVNLERCSLSWSEEHQTRESNQRTLAESNEITIELALLDRGAIRSEGLKHSGYQVSLITKGLKPGVVTKQRMQWGDGPVTESKGLATGAAFYFRDGKAAKKVSKAIATLVRTCQKTGND